MERRIFKLKKSKIYPWYFALGSVLIYTVLSVLPGIIGIGYSFTDWSAYSKEIHFVGWKNFINVFSGTEDYFRYILNTLLFTLITTLAKTGLGLLFAVLLTDKVKCQNLHRNHHSRNHHGSYPLLGRFLFLPSVYSSFP